MDYREILVGEGVSVRVGFERSFKNTLIECQEAAVFLNYLSPKGITVSIPHRALVRGVYQPEIGAYFELRDAFGLVAEDIVTLGPEEAQRLLMDAL